MGGSPVGPCPETVFALALERWFEVELQAGVTSVPTAPYVENGRGYGLKLVVVLVTECEKRVVTSMIDP